MTSAAEIQAGIDGMLLDLTRLHNFLKGDDEVTIVGDDGSYPSLAKWLVDLGLTFDDGLAQASLIVPCTVVNNGAYWTLTPKPGYPLVAGGANQILLFDAPVDSPANIGLRLVGVNDTEERFIRQPDGVSNYLAGAIQSGATCGVRYSVAGTERQGLFQLLWGSVPLQPAAAFTPIVPVTITNSGTFWTIAPVSPFVIEGSGSDQVLVGVAPAAHSGTLLSLQRPPFLTESRQVTGPDLTTRVTTANVIAGGVVMFKYKPTGLFELLLPSVSSAGGTKTEIPCNIVDNGTYWTFTPIQSGQIVDTGLHQTFSGRAPANSGGSLNARIIGINDSDQRNVRLSDGTSQVPTNGVVAGGRIEIKYHPSGPRAGLIELVTPSPVATGGSSSLMTKMVQTARVNNTITMAPAPGNTLPNNTGDDTIMVIEILADGLPEASWLIMVTGINGTDPFALRYRDGTAVPPTALKTSDRLFLERPGGTGAVYTVFDHWKADTAQGSNTATTPYAARRAFYTARNNQISAIG